jgi:hypothetical protein
VGTTKYVENPVGDPYLKRFGFLVAAQDFDAGTPFILGISAKERTLRVCAIQDSGEE